MKWNIKKKEKYVEMSSVLIWKIVQQTFKKHSNNPKQSEKSPLLMKLVKMNEMKRTAHTVSFVLANFLLVFSKDLLLNCEYIWARQPKKKETRVKKWKKKNNAYMQMIFFCYIIYIYSPWIILHLGSLANVKEANAIVSQWCIRFEYASCEMLDAR